MSNFSKNGYQYLIQRAILHMPTFGGTILGCSSSRFFGVVLSCIIVFACIVLLLSVETGIGLYGQTLFWYYSL